jgi:hypothetical protein
MDYRSLEAVIQTASKKMPSLPQGHLLISACLKLSSVTASIAEAVPLQPNFPKLFDLQEDDHEREQCEGLDKRQA